MESTSREKEKAKEKGRWREENGGPVKCRWRVVGRGAVWRGALQFIFSIQRAPPPLLYCPSVWQLELAMWRGEQKRACCPAWVCGHIGRHHISPPPPPKKSRANQTGPAGMKPEAEHTPIDSTILQHPPKTLKCVIVPSRISCKTKTVSAFGFPLFSHGHNTLDTSHVVLSAHLHLQISENYSEPRRCFLSSLQEGMQMLMAREVNFSNLQDSDSVLSRLTHSFCSGLLLQQCTTDAEVMQGGRLLLRLPVCGFYYW